MRAAESGWGYAITGEWIDRQYAFIVEPGRPAMCGRS
jgi:hypothetical protein